MYERFILSKCGYLFRKPEGGPVSSSWLAFSSSALDQIPLVWPTGSHRRTGLIRSWGFGACILTDTMSRLPFYIWALWIPCPSPVVLSYHQSLPGLITTATKRRFPQKRRSTGVSRKSSFCWVDSNNKTDDVVIVIRLVSVPRILQGIRTGIHNNVVHQKQSTGCVRVYHTAEQTILGRVWPAQVAKVGGLQRAGDKL